jgi:hypothetical protein
MMYNLVFAWCALQLVELALITISHAHLAEMSLLVELRHISICLLTHVLIDAHTSSITRTSRIDLVILVIQPARFAWVQLMTALCAMTSL